MESIMIRGFKAGIPFLKRILFDFLFLHADKPIHCIFMAAGDQGKVRSFALIHPETCSVTVAFFMISEPHDYLADVREKLPKIFHLNRCRLVIEV